MVTTELYFRTTTGTSGLFRAYENSNHIECMLLTAKQGVKERFQLTSEQLKILLLAIK